MDDIFVPEIFLKDSNTYKLSVKDYKRICYVFCVSITVLGNEQLPFLPIFVWFEFIWHWLSRHLKPVLFVIIQ